MTAAWPDHFDRYPCARCEIERALAANHGSIWGDDVDVEFVGMPDDFDAAFREFNRRVNEGDTRDAVVRRTGRPDDPREAGE